MKYDDADYANTRLAGTIVRTKDGEPVRVKNVGYNFLTIIEPLDDAGLKEIGLYDLDLEPVPLGYVQHDNAFVYVCRAPMREDWRQGLRHNNMRIVAAEDAELRPRDLSNHYLRLCIRGEYADFDDCIKQIKLGRDTVAFHREWAITAYETLLHKGFEVGEFYLDRRECTLYEDYSFLSEALEETL